MIYDHLEKEVVIIRTHFILLKNNACWIHVISLEKLLLILKNVYSQMNLPSLHPQSPCHWL